MYLEAVYCFLQNFSQWAVVHFLCACVHCAFPGRSLPPLPRKVQGTTHLAWTSNHRFSFSFRSSKLYCGKCSFGALTSALITWCPPIPFKVRKCANVFALKVSRNARQAGPSPSVLCRTSTESALRKNREGKLMARLSSYRKVQFRKQCV